jgi:hypothetical protein
MTDNRNLQQDKRDGSRIDANDPLQVNYVHHQFPWLSYEEIKKAIKEKGPDRDAVTAYLERKGSSGSPREES